MTYTNEKKLLGLLAEAHVGDSIFTKKHNIEIHVVIPNDGFEPTVEELSELNERYAEQFAEQVAKKLSSEEVSADFLYDLLFSAPSVLPKTK